MISVKVEYKNKTLCFCFKHFRTLLHANLSDEQNLTLNIPMGWGGSSEDTRG